MLRHHVKASAAAADAPHNLQHSAQVKASHPDAQGRGQGKSRSSQRRTTSPASDSLAKTGKGNQGTEAAGGRRAPRRGGLASLRGWGRELQEKEAQINAGETPHKNRGGPRSGPTSLQTPNAGVRPLFPFVFFGLKKPCLPLCVF